MIPQPGDFACVSISGAGGVAVELGQIVDGDGRDSLFEHALVYLGDGLIVQAEPDGAQMTKLGKYTRELWSSGRVALSAAQRQDICQIARGYVGVTPYSWMDYAAIGLHRLHVNAPGLKQFIASSGHMICSQLVDQCYAMAGVHLFTDNRWPGYVTPGDLAELLSAK